MRAAVDYGTVMVTRLACPARYLRPCAILPAAYTDASGPRKGTESHLPPSNMSIVLLSARHADTGRMRKERVCLFVSSRHTRASIS